MHVEPFEATKAVAPFTVEAVPCGKMMSVYLPMAAEMEARTCASLGVPPAAFSSAASTALSTAFCTSDLRSFKRAKSMLAETKKLSGKSARANVIATLPRSSRRKDAIRYPKYLFILAS